MQLRRLSFVNEPIPAKALKPDNKYIVKFGLAFFAIAIWLVLSDYLEIYITEWSWIRNDVPISWNLTILVILLAITSLIATKLNFKTSNKNIIFLVTSLLTFFGVLIGHSQYKEYYNWLQTFPKIKTISKNWTIHGDRIAIIGQNFGDPWKHGAVWMDEVEYTIVSWNDERIVAEQPVTGLFKKGKLVIKNEYGNTIVISPFEIKNPTEVLGQ